MDYVSDQNPRALFYLVDTYELPEYVKSASLPEEEIEKLPNHAFADVARREFPVHTKAAAWLSYAYAVTAGQTGLLDRIKKASAVHQIENDLRALDEFLAKTHTKKASDRQPAHALTVKTASGDVQKFYPLNSAYQVVESSRQIMDDRYKLPIEWLRDASKAVVKQAAVHSVDNLQIPDLIWNMGEDRVPDMNLAMEVAETRAALFQHTPEVGEIYIDLVKAASVDESGIETVVQGFIELDALNGVDYRFNVDPYRAFYSGPRVSEIEALAAGTVKVANVIVPMEEFVNKSEDFWKDILRHETASQLDEAIKVASRDNHSRSLDEFFASADDSVSRSVLRALLHD